MTEEEINIQDLEVTTNCSFKLNYFSCTINPSGFSDVCVSVFLRSLSAVGPPWALPLIVISHLTESGIEQHC